MNILSVICYYSGLTPDYTNILDYTIIDEYFEHCQRYSFEPLQRYAINLNDECEITVAVDNDFLMYKCDTLNYCKITLEEGKELKEKYFFIMDFKYNNAFNSVTFSLKIDYFTTFGVYVSPNNKIFRIERSITKPYPYQDIPIATSYPQVPLGCLDVKKKVNLYSKRYVILFLRFTFNDYPQIPMYSYFYPKSAPLSCMLLPYCVYDTFEEKIYEKERTGTNDTVPYFTYSYGSSDYYFAYKNAGVSLYNDAFFTSVNDCDICTLPDSFYSITATNIDGTTGIKVKINNIFNTHEFKIGIIGFYSFKDPEGTTELYYPSTDNFKEHYTINIPSVSTTKTSTLQHSRTHKYTLYLGSCTVDLPFPTNIIRWEIEVDKSSFYDYVDIYAVTYTKAYTNERIKLNDLPIMVQPSGSQPFTVNSLNQWMRGNKETNLISQKIARNQMQSEIVSSTIGIAAFAASGGTYIGGLASAPSHIYGIQDAYYQEKKLKAEALDADNIKDSVYCQGFGGMENMNALPLLRLIITTYNENDIPEEIVKEQGETYRFGILLNINKTYNYVCETFDYIKGELIEELPYVSNKCSEAVKNAYMRGVRIWHIIPYDNKFDQSQNNKFIVAGG